MLKLSLTIQCANKNSLLLIQAVDLFLRSCLWGCLPFYLQNLVFLSKYLALAKFCSLQYCVVQSTNKWLLGDTLFLCAIEVKSTFLSFLILASSFLCESHALKVIAWWRHRIFLKYETMKGTLALYLRCLLKSKQLLCFSDLILWRETHKVIFSIFRNKRMRKAIFWVY